VSAIQIRDAVHGTIDVSADERALLDHPLVARLRGVRQLGFVEHVFPGATHSRYAHALGVMHVATRIFDGVVADGAVSTGDRERMRRALRLAALLHDVGHPPFSHSLEGELPDVSRMSGSDAHGARHEAFSGHLLMSPSLAGAIGSAGADVNDVAGILRGDSRFASRGVDFGPLLHSVVAGELDADRMDYLLRDSHHVGVSYGRYDFEWVVRNLAMTIEKDAARLALSHRALYAFDDFLFSRLQMFLAVYFHATPVAFDEMLQRHFASGASTFSIPADPDSFSRCDDGALIENLRRSHEPWARRIVARAPFRLLYETDREPEKCDCLASELENGGIPSFTTTSKGVVSKYFGGDPPLLVIEGEHVCPVSEVASLLKNHSRPVQIARVYVAPEGWDVAVGARNRLRESFG
jgi:HD superfamily phosphohydrolase